MNRPSKKRSAKRAIVVGKNEPGAGFRTTHTVRGIGRVIVVTAPDGELFEVYRLDPLTSIEMYAGTFATAVHPDQPRLSRVLSAHIKAQAAARRERRDEDTFSRAGKTTRVHFDGSPSWPVLAIVDTWNGFAVPIVTPSVREQIAAYLDREGEDDSGAEMRAIKPTAPGRIELRGWAFSEVEDDDDAPTTKSRRR